MEDVDVELSREENRRWKKRCAGDEGGEGCGGLGAWSERMVDETREPRDEFDRNCKNRDHAIEARRFLSIKIWG